MKKINKSYTPLLRIIAIFIVFMFIASIGVIATNSKLTSVKIILSNNYEMTVFTFSTSVKDILEENHILLTEDEVSVPNVEEELGDNKTIRIVKAIDLQPIAEKETVLSKEEILQSYNTITEKIVIEQVEIPYETITKEATDSNDGMKQNRVVQKGKNGLKEVKYKVKYQNDVEIERIEIESRIIREPVNKIVEVKSYMVTARGMVQRASGTVAEYQAYAKQRCFDYGWTESDFYCLVLLWNRESNWRVTAKNKSSGAYGIPQSLPASKMAAFGSDYLTNYKTQINWGLSYIKARYKNPTNAWDHSQRTGWY